MAVVDAPPPGPGSRGRPWGRLQRAEEVQEILLVPLTQRLERVDGGVRLRLRVIRIDHAPVGMGLDRLSEILCAAIVQQEDPLAEPPERGGAELVACGLTLAYVVGQPWPHVVNEEVGE